MKGKGKQMKTKLNKLVPSAWCLVLSAKMVLMVALCAVGFAAFAEQPSVTYLDWDDVEKKMTNAVCTAYEVVTNDMDVLEAGKTYVVMGSVSNSVGIAVEGTADNPTRLILCDGAKLVSTECFRVMAQGATTNALVICGQANGTGVLEASSSVGVMGAGIGGGGNQDCGIVTINGGTIVANGFTGGAAGIGGGRPVMDGPGSGGTVTINGGTVTAIGTTRAEGIGRGWNSFDEKGKYSGTVKFGAKFNVLVGDDAASAKPIAQEEYEKDHSAKYVHIERPEISAVSAEGWIDLTVGDRVAKVPEETLVVDPAWGEAVSATVDFTFGGSTVETRTYNCASNDLWQTTALTPGRYTLALTAGTTNETAAFWKTGDNWVVLDNVNITEAGGMTFESGKTYLVLGTNFAMFADHLIVEDRAKFEYGKDSGFLGGSDKLDENLPRRYDLKQIEGLFYQIVEKIKGCEDNPWDVGEGVTAYTNGNELVISGKGTITDLSEVPSDVKDGITVITVAEPTVKGAESGAFADFDGVKVTLPDNWQGELLEKGAWYGATNAELTYWPKAVKNVKPLPRYPWNGLVDVTFDLTGEGEVAVTVQVTVDGKTLANPTLDGKMTFDLGKGTELKGLKLTWNAGADFDDAELHQKIKVKLTVAPGESD